MKSRSLVCAATVVLLAAASAASAQVGKGLIDVNTASEKELTALPHMTSEIVKKVVEKRPFDSITDLNTLLIQQKLTKEQAAEFYEKAFVHINLNTAKKDEILLIPKIAKKMSHEFAEYRPWTTWKQFDKEIGKYVGQTETDRLKQYCFIPLDANTASEEMLATIPGIKDDVVQRIISHRPWKTLRDFAKDLEKPVREAKTDDSGLKDGGKHPVDPAPTTKLDKNEEKRIVRYLVVENEK